MPHSFDYRAVEAGMRQARIERANAFRKAASHIIRRVRLTAHSFVAVFF